MEGDGQRSRPGRGNDPSAADDIHPDPYGHLAERFVEHYGTLRGAVRFALLAEQLDGQLPAGPCRIVDVGGGAGHQAIRLARLGHVVTVVDPSSEMLGRASAAPGGLLSLVFKNADALAMRPALEGRWADALAAFDAAEDVGGLGVPTRCRTTCSTCPPTTCWRPCCRSRPPRRGVTRIALSVASSTSSPRAGTSRAPSTGRHRVQVSRVAGWPTQQVSER